MRVPFLILLLLVVCGPVLAETRVPRSQAEIGLSFAPLVRAAAPAVVNIYAKRITQAQSRPTPFMNDPFFERFFRDFGQPEPRVQNSLGSGVILSPSGVVVSNYHVVGMATEIRVVLNDRREFSARVLLADEESDLAILQLDGADDLPHLPLRDSDTVEVGELVLAIGNPFGVGQTVTSGIVSGLARSGGAGGSGRGYFIQTDAPINPGNSGGALLDMDGHLIGINTSILSRSGGSNGIGFAIPSDLVAAFVSQAKAGHTAFVRPWAGMAGQPVDTDLARTLGLDLPGGIVISGIHPSSPFAEAGFAVGDVIVAVDGAPVNSPAEMVFRMSVAGEGSKTMITRVRDGVASDIAVSLIAAPDVPPRDTLRLPDRSILPGLTLSRVNPAIIAERNLPLAIQGVVIEDPGVLGRRMGLRPGDVIQRVGRDAVDTPRDVLRKLAAAGRGTTMVLLRGQRRIVVRF